MGCYIFGGVGGGDIKVKDRKQETDKLAKFLFKNIQWQDDVITTETAVEITSRTQ